MAGTNLSGANLKDADLAGAYLSYAIGLTKEQLLEAIVDDRTVAPEGPAGEYWLKVLEASRKRRAEREAEDG